MGRDRTGWGSYVLGITLTERVEGSRLADGRSCNTEDATNKRAPVDRPTAVYGEGSGGAGSAPCLRL